MDAGFNSVNALGYFVHQAQGKLQLGRGIAALRQGGAHKGLAAFLAQHHLGQDGFIVLDKVGPGVAQGDGFLAQDGDHIPGQILRTGIDFIGQTLEPAGTGQHIGAGQGDFDRPVGVLFQESQFIPGQAVGGGDFCGNDGAFDGKGRHIQGAQGFLQPGAVAGIVQQLGNLHQLHPGDFADHIGIEVVPPLLSVAEQVRADRFLSADGFQDRLIGHGVELIGGNFLGLTAAQGLNQFRRPRPTAHHGYREQG